LVWLELLLRLQGGSGGNIEIKMETRFCLEDVESCWLVLLTCCSADLPYPHI